MTHLCEKCAKHPAAELLGLTLCMECAGLLTPGQVAPSWGQPEPWRCEECGATGADNGAPDACPTCGATGACMPLPRCEQRCGAVATVYAMGPRAGDWGGRYCEPCARRLGFTVTDRL